MKDQLTSAMVAASAELARNLRESGLPIVAAFWLFDPELHEWRLLLASPDVSTQGPLKVYEGIHRALEELGDKASAAPLSAIGLLDKHADLVKLIRGSIRRDPMAVPCDYRRTQSTGTSSRTR